MMHTSDERISKVKIGIFGGTFNPPHLGHLIIAEHVREKFGLDKVIFVPSAVPPHKRELDIVEAHHRIEMLNAAVQGNRHFEVSELEIQRGGVSFTVDTLMELWGLYHDHELYLLIGMDNWVEFHTWRTPEKILELAHLVVMTRSGVESRQNGMKLADKVIFCEVPEIGIASRDIRKRIADSKSIRYQVPLAVELYIYQHQLYRTMSDG